MTPADALPAPSLDRAAAFARWERREKVIAILRRALPAAMGVIGLAMVAWVTASSLRAPKPVKTDTPVIRMVGARFQGRIEDGRSFLIGAQEAIRDERAPQRVTLVEPILIIGAETPMPRRLMARQGVYDEQTRLLRLTGDVRIDDGLGNRIASADTIIDTRTGTAVGKSGIEGDGPTGQVAAGSYSVSEKGNRVEFKGGVRTRINPE